MPLGGYTLDYSHETLYQVVRRKVVIENVTSAHIYREGSKKNWGEPLKIVMAIIDRRCPICDHSIHDELRLDFGKENGKIFGGICFNCGWRFYLGG